MNQGERLAYPPCRAGFEKHFRIRGGGEDAAQCLPQFAVVEDFPVEHDRPTTVARVHGLASGLAQIENREPPMA
jgi:hypothetical protein